MWILEITVSHWFYRYETFARNNSKKYTNTAPLTIVLVLLTFLTCFISYHSFKANKSLYLFSYCENLLYTICSDVPSMSQIPLTNRLAWTCIMFARCYMKKRPWHQLSPSSSAECRKRIILNTILFIYTQFAHTADAALLFHFKFYIFK